MDDQDHYTMISRDLSMKITAKGMSWIWGNYFSMQFEGDESEQVRVFSSWSADFLHFFGVSPKSLRIEEHKS